MDRKTYEVLVTIFRKKPPGSIVGCRQTYREAWKLGREGLIREVGLGCFKSNEEKREEVENLIEEYEQENGVKK